jgi:hypothetical protein
MASRAVFISSTYKDLAQHRRAVWEVLLDLDVTVRGMEEFGARSEGPLETCLAELEQSDVYVGIVAFRVGSIDAKSGRCFTQLESEHARSLEKAVLVYLADEETACFPYTSIDHDARECERLAAFKQKLRSEHTVERFSTPDDLAQKIRRDFARNLVLKQTPAESEMPREEEFSQSTEILREFQLTPKTLNGREVLLTVAFTNSPFPASRSLCAGFNLEYGATIGVAIRVTRPSEPDVVDKFSELYATGSAIDPLRKLIGRGDVDIYARLGFSPECVRDVRAEFFGKDYMQISASTTGFSPMGTYALGSHVHVPPDGKVALLFSKPG